jgi:hypothetical protein
MPQTQTVPPRPGAPSPNAIIPPALTTATQQLMVLPTGRHLNDPVTQAVFRMADSVEQGWVPPRKVAIGKSTSRSLMQPQSLALRLFLAETCKTLVEYYVVRVPTKCGPDWPTKAIEIAWTTGPQVLALTPENIKLVWDEVAHQVEAGFVRLVPEQELFTQGMPSNLKVSRLAVVPQRNRQGWLILNLSAGVKIPPKRIPGS